MSKRKKLTIRPMGTPSGGQTVIPTFDTSQVGQKIYWCLFEAMKGKCACEVCEKLREIGSDIQKQWMK